MKLRVTFDVETNYDIQGLKDVLALCFDIIRDEWTGTTDRFDTSNIQISEIKNSHVQSNESK